MRAPVVNSELSPVALLASRSAPQRFIYPQPTFWRLRALRTRPTHRHARCRALQGAMTPPSEQDGRVEAMLHAMHLLEPRSSGSRPLLSLIHI